MEFTELNLHPDLQRGLEDAGYVTCMPVQEQVFAHSFSGQDIYAQSQTGTGKTAAFLISIFQRIMTVPESRNRKVLILAPTRELAVQIEGEAKKLGKHLPVTSGAFYGGVAYGPQVDMLRDNVQMIIGTPGRIIDLVKQGKMLLREVGFLVIDEADRMFDMGFIDDLRKLIRYLPSADDRQTYLFSATLGLRVKDLAWEYMREPKEVSIEPEHVTVDLVTQELYHVGTHEKMPLLLGILDREKPKSCIVFCNQKFMVEEVARRLKINGHDCEYLMGDLPQSQRLRIIERLKAGELDVLVATDVAARGLDVEALDLVVNYDIPDEVESYVHRIGRTARAGKAGKAVTLACEKFVFGLPSIEKYLGQKIPVAPFDGSLLLADKSEGMRFSRSHSGPGGRDAGRGDRGPRRDGGRDGGRGRDGAYAGRDGHRGDRGPRREGSHAPDRSRSEDRSRSGERVRAPGRPERAGTDSAGNGANDANLYALSAEERMKLYKERYAGAEGQSGGAPAGDRRPRGEGNRPRQGQGRGRQGGQGGQRGQRREGERSAAGGRPAPRQGAGAQQGERRHAPTSTPKERARKPAPHGSDRAPHSSASPIAAKPAAAKKPGLLDKLKGLFGGKKRGE